MAFTNLRPDFKNFKLIQGWYTPNLFSPDHIDGCDRISVVLYGDVVERSGNREEFASISSIVIKPCDFKHQNQYGPKGAKILSVIFKDRKSTQLFKDYIRECRWIHGVRTIPFTGRLIMGILQCDTEFDVEECLIDFFSSYNPASGNNQNRKPLWLDRVKEIIHAEYARPIRTRELAETAGIHPVHLAREFRKSFLCTVREYITRLRILNTVRKMSASDLSLSQIAYENGFADQSHLNRHFKKQTGITPGHYKKLINC